MGDVALEGDQDKLEPPVIERRELGLDESGGELHEGGGVVVAEGAGYIDQRNEHSQFKHNVSSLPGVGILIADADERHVIRLAMFRHGEHYPCG